MSLHAVLFDLDGTLVDSSIGVLSSLAAAFDNSGCVPTKSFSTELIGPPLRETLCLVSGDSDPLLLDQLAANFKAHYDTIGFQETSPFPGVDQMLQSLADAKLPLHIATNKRQRPTSQILDALGWTSLFDLVLSPDSFNPPLPSKAAILSSLLAKVSLDAKDCLYIGDRFDDYNAAQESGIPFALAEWGFEGDVSDFPPNIIQMGTPDAGRLISYFTSKTTL
jgi:phosphoglycolate phosphatase